MFLHFGRLNHGEEEGMDRMGSREIWSEAIVGSR